LGNIYIEDVCITTLKCSKSHLNLSSKSVIQPTMNFNTSFIINRTKHTNMLTATVGAYVANSRKSSRMAMQQSCLDKFILIKKI